MKKGDDPRHIARIHAMQSLFSYAFTKSTDYCIEEDENGNEQELPFNDKAKLVIDHVSDIDKYIEKAAPAFPPDKIAKIDLSILRLAIYELAFEKKNPPKVIIDEAVELGKEYGNESTGSFVNGVLGTVLTEVTSEA